MQEKMYILFFIVCAIFAQAIGTSSEENMKKSSNLLIRKKRVFDPTPNGNQPVDLVHVPYIVSIEEEGQYICGGSILASNIIATAAHCVDEPNVTYKVKSGSSHVVYGILHNVTRKLIHPQFNFHTLFTNDLALLVIEPHINFRHSQNREISLFNGHLPPNTLGVFSGWGCHGFRRGRMLRPARLRSIIVPTISTEECAHFYRDIDVITDKELCTHDIVEGKCGGDGDSGNPLAVNGHLVGIMSWSKVNQIGEAPDVFMNVAHPSYNAWIIENMRHINGHINN